MISYWEKSEFTHYDLIVIGGGITGLFCALEFRKKNPTASIAVFEQGIFPDGASTKNAGFACFGSITELIDDEAKMGSTALLSLLERRVKGLEKLRKTLGDSTIDFQQNGGYELFFNEQTPNEATIHKFNSLLHPLFKSDVFSKDITAVERFGFSSTSVSAVIKNPFEAQINTGMMMGGLLKKVREQNIVVYSNTKVAQLETSPNNNQVSVQYKGNNIHFKSTFLAICNNAFAKQFSPESEIKPGRGLVVLTKPIDHLKIKGCFHYKEGYYYFRNIHNRILFGGGRELDIQGETTTEHGINAKIKEQLLNDLAKFIHPGTVPKIEMEWTGIMAFGKTKQPIVQKINETAAMGVRLGGMGVALGSLIGKETCDLLN